MDVTWKYLNFFLSDDAKLKHIEAEYGSGRMLTGEAKAELIKVQCFLDMTAAFAPSQFVLILNCPYSEAPLHSDCNDLCSISVSVQLLPFKKSKQNGTSHTDVLMPLFLMKLWVTSRANTEFLSAFSAFAH